MNVDVEGFHIEVDDVNDMLFGLAIMVPSLFLVVLVPDSF
jgi:hypothetical protein